MGVFAFERSGGPPLPPSEVLAMVESGFEVKLVSVLENSCRNHVEN